MTTAIINKLPEGYRIIIRDAWGRKFYFLLPQEVVDRIICDEGMMDYAPGRDDWKKEDVVPIAGGGDEVV